MEAATTGRRGPGQPGSARVFPGESASSAASFGPGMPLDVLPGCAALAVAADAAVGEGDRFAGVSEAELIGVVCAWDRSRPTPAPASSPPSPSWSAPQPRPARTSSSPPTRLAYALAESRGRAGDLVDLAQTLHTRLPGTAAALDDGIITRSKAEIIAALPPCSMTPRPAPPRARSWTGPGG